MKISSLLYSLLLLYSFPSFHIPPSDFVPLIVFHTWDINRRASTVVSTFKDSDDSFGNWMDGISSLKTSENLSVPIGCLPCCCYCRRCRSCCCFVLFLLSSSSHPNACRRHYHHPCLRPGRRTFFSSLSAMYCIRCHLCRCWLCEFRIIIIIISHSIPFIWRSVIVRLFFLISNGNIQHTWIKLRLLFIVSVVFCSLLCRYRFRVRLSKKSFHDIVVNVVIFCIRSFFNKLFLFILEALGRFRDCVV